MTSDPTDAGYDEATEIPDGRGSIPSGVDPTEVGPRADPRGALPPGMATAEDNVTDDVHDVDTWSNTTVPHQPKPEVNTTDNQAEWSQTD